MKRRFLTTRRMVERAEKIAALITEAEEAERDAEGYAEIEEEVAENYALTLANNRRLQALWMERTGEF